MVPMHGPKRRKYLTAIIFSSIKLRQQSVRKAGEDNVFTNNISKRHYCVMRFVYASISIQTRIRSFCTGNNLVLIAFINQINLMGRSVLLNWIRNKQNNL